MTKNIHNNIVSTSPNCSQTSDSTSSNQSIGAYIEKVFKNPYSTLLSSSSSLPLTTHQDKWELPTPSSSSPSEPSSSSPSSSPKATSSTSSSSTDECEWLSPHSDTESSNFPCTEKWYDHRHARKKTPRYVVATT